jgi:cell division protein FtsW (lipid II flippase)
MALTYTSSRQRDRASRMRRPELDRIDLLFVLTSMAAALIIFMAYSGKVRASQLDAAPATLVNLNTAGDADALLAPMAAAFDNDAARRAAARELFRFLVADDGTRRVVPNVGAITRARTRANPGVPVFDGASLSALKPLVVVRNADAFRRQVLIFGGLYLAAFLLVAIVWRLARVDGDRVTLAAVHALTAIGFAVLLSRPDPLRDTLLFVRYAETVVAGLVIMLGASLIRFGKIDALRLNYLPLIGALGLSALLLLFGSGPGNSEAKVNLGPVQPIEGIRLLLAFFLAGYFARRWEVLRSLRGRTFRSVNLPEWLTVPRLDYVLPVAAGVGLSLVFFFFQKDLGPALFICCVFLAVYAVARARVVMAAAGLLTLVAGFYLGHLWNVSATLEARVRMWLSPWDNDVAGGNQVTHAIWAMASGGSLGSGLGAGASRYLPAGHTDLILAAVGEELGLIGLLVVGALYAIIARRGLRIARSAPGDYGYFLALALTLFIIVPVFLMAAGIMGLTPLTGVVTPFLSYGGSAMLANFAALGLLSCIHADRRPEGDTAPFTVPTRWLAASLGAAALVLVATATYIQVVKADALAVRAHLGIQADGGRRFEYNPRLIEVLRSLKSGTVMDRTGLPLATSSAEVIDAARDRYLAMGIDLALVCPRAGERCYPLGDRAFHLLGNARTRANWSAPNTSYIERDAEDLLRGFNDHATPVSTTTIDGKPMVAMRRDYSELLPVMRHRNDPAHPAVVKFFSQPHDVTVTIDAALQYRVADIVADYARRSSQKAAAVVIDPDSGALLASASYPWPSALAAAPRDSNLDRARYGLYPPGSTFKIVVESALFRSGFDPASATFTCSRLPDGRVGAMIKGRGRPIRDDIHDKVPHGTIGLHDGLVHSCNAYFAQLAVRLGPQPLIDAATQLGISLTPSAGRLERVKETLPQVGYGQADVLASPLRMARAAAAIGAGGLLREVQWRADLGDAPVRTEVFLEPAAAARLGQDMRDVVVSGTGRTLRDHPGRIAGKTGTAEVTDKPSHGWFVGYAPFGPAARPNAAPGTTKRIAFAVIIENAGYGGATAAPAAGEIVSAAIAAGFIK